MPAMDMAGMDMGSMDVGGMAPPAAFASFIVLWVAMMAAMMLPGLTPTLWRRAEAGGAVHDIVLFVASYLVVWGLVGVPVYALYRPLDAMIAGVATIAAGIYELTPLKRSFRRRCRDDGHSGFTYGLCCLGSSVALMLMQVAPGLMSVSWMVIASVLIVGQKLLPARLVVDVPVAVTIVALGMLIVVAPSSVPGLTPLM